MVTKLIAVFGLLITSVGLLLFWALQNMANAAPVLISRSTANMSYFTAERGSQHTLDYRVFIKAPDGKLVSPWHDIPLYADPEKKIFNMVVEIPRWSNAKMEMATKEPMTPIRQDEKKGKVRFVDNIYPYHGYIFNYGALPQTWENPEYVDKDTKAKGDNDPIDVVEIGDRIHKCGAVIKVKVLGVLALLDEGETDWKLVVIDVDDPKAAKLNDIEDVREQMPDLLEQTRRWFRDYKFPSKGTYNEFAFGGEFKDRNFAHQTIEGTHEHWKELIKRQAKGELVTECHQPEAHFKADDMQWEQLFLGQPQPGPANPVPNEINNLHFVQ